MTGAHKWGWGSSSEGAAFWGWVEFMRGGTAHRMTVPRQKRGRVIALECGAKASTITAPGVFSVALLKTRWVEPVDFQTVTSGARTGRTSEGSSGCKVVFGEGTEKVDARVLPPRAVPGRIPRKSHQNKTAYKVTDTN